MYIVWSWAPEGKRSPHSVQGSQAVGRVQLLTANKKTLFKLLRPNFEMKKPKKNKAKALFLKFRVIFNPFPAAANKRA
ncbi:hypothetical protein [Sinorhizobium arboris]|uniref:hypothetical protein n=1 Tax=Sinorhizobium arboris TaxID=76745 RepID=UPI000423DAC8|nr:hypothetical protein [Sinorhizobium arboris]